MIRIDGRGALSELLFGKPGCPEPRIECARPSGEAPDRDASKIASDDACALLWGASGPFRAALPAPALWYGLNFV